MGLGGFQPQRVFGVSTSEVCDRVNELPLVSIHQKAKSQKTTKRINGI